MLSSLLAIEQRMILIVSLGVAMLGVGQAHAQDAANDTKRWAIVPIDPEGRALADLLTVELSTWDSVKLLERDRIRSVLAELQLNASDLVSNDSVTRLGQLSQADALVIIDVPKEDNQAKSLRLRLVDTRTSVRLLDVLLPSGELSKEVAAICDELRLASATLQVPVERLLLIGVVPFKSGEPGKFLEPFCQAVTTLVEVGLHQNPRFIMVERSELQRLIAETDVSGVPLQLRASSTLLEVSIHRAAGGVGMEVHGRLILHGNAQNFDLTVASGRLVDVRDQIIGAVSSAMGDAKRLPSLSLEAEAKVFDRRAALSSSNYRPFEAAEMADAAMALAPSLKRLRLALAEYTRATRDEDWRKRMAARHRYQQLRIEWWAKTKSGDRIRKTLKNRAIYGPDTKFRAKRPRPRSNEYLQLVDEWHALGNQIFDQFYAEASDAQRRLWLLKQKLAKLGRLYSKDAEFVNAVHRLVAQMSVEMKRAGISEDLNSLDYAEFTVSLISVVNQIGRRADLVYLRGRLIKPQGFSIRLGSEHELAVQVAQLYGQAVYLRDQDAAPRFLALLDLWRPSENLSRTTVNAPSKAAAGFMPLDYNDYKAQRIERALLARRAAVGLHLTAHRLAVQRLFPKDGKQHLDAKFRKNAPFYTPRVRDLHENTRGYAKPVFSLDAGEGAWQQYVAKPIKLTNVASEHYALLSVFVDHRANANRDGGELVLVWRNFKYTHVSIERVGLSGGTPRKMGPSIPGVKFPAFRNVSIAVSPDAIFVASELDGIVMLRKRSFESFTEELGFPSNDVWSMTWHRDRLYIAFRDSFGVFDPKTKSFQLLASGTSFEPRNPIDGRGSFFIRYLISDEPNDCIWMTIQDNAVPRIRNGFWQFHPDTNTYRKISGGSTVPTRTEGGMLLHDGSRVTYLDTRTTVLTTLSEFAPASIGTPYPTPLLIKVGDHIISDRAKLHTHDGQEYQLETDARWNLFQRVGRGFITHYDEKSKTLWYVEPKSLPGAP